MEADPELLTDGDAAGVVAPSEDARATTDILVPVDDNGAAFGVELHVGLAT
jgi:hypothetical protein